MACSGKLKKLSELDERGLHKSALLSLSSRGVKIPSMPDSVSD